MAGCHNGQPTLVNSLATLLRNHGASVLDGSSTLTLQADSLQHLGRLFEQYLLSRTHQHGFLALPSHPADTTSLLQLQFLFDVLQKTVSLKLINPPGSRLQSVVKIFPFKSLKSLELKRIPPHCLEDLRGVYSQLEVFTCSKSLSSLEELLSLCGGDLSSALPWLELHTLNFSYNAIVCLDESLSLLNVLKSLDLSHNKIQECADFLKPLSELEHLNLGFNNLQRAPTLGLSSRAKLLTLILRNNELETINGVEQLSSLQHLDLAYNLLLDHSQLAPLSMLHSLNMLNLKGNPLFFQKTHRTRTVRHLSPKAAYLRLRLDSSPLSSSELSVLPKPGQLIGQLQSQASPLITRAPERGNQEVVSSGGGELSDSLSVSEVGVTRQRKKKAKSKVRVRRASISEPSDYDYDYEPRPQSSIQDIVLPHQKEIERMDSFRDQLGEDWLRYQHHLEGAPIATLDKAYRPAPPHLNNSLCDTPSPTNNSPIQASPATFKPPSPELEVPEVLPPPLLSSEPKEEASDWDADLETESTLQWPDHSLGHTESTLETTMAEGLGQGLEGTPATPTDTREEEEEDLGVDLCHPLLVGVLSSSDEEEEEEEGLRRKNRAQCPVFLRVKPRHVLEVDMSRGQLQARLELDSLGRFTMSQVTWTEREVERTLPAVELHFRYISRERRRRRYVMLDDDPQEALQDPTMEGPSSARASHFGSPAMKASTQDTIQTSTSMEDPTSFFSAKGSSFSLGETWEDQSCDRSLSQPASFYSTEGQSKGSIAGTCSYAVSATSPGPQDQHAEQASPGQLDLLSEDYEAVDHRLKLFLDVEVFEEEEELHSFLKVSTVKFGDPVEFPSFLVVSDQRIYFLEVTSDMEGQPCDWLQKRESRGITELSYLEVGLGSQSIHMEFEDGPVAYTLLVRDSVRCKRFFSLFTGVVRELATKSDSKLKSISTTRLNPQHHLWPLVCEDMQTDVEDGQLQFFYLLSFLHQEDRVTPLTVLATRETLYLLNEDHQWSKSLPHPSANENGGPCSGRVTVQETQPISCVSSVHLWSSDPCRMDIKLYDEIVKEEKTWSLHSDSAELVQDLLVWVRTQWENMFGVKLAITNLTLPA
uniref:Serine/threonine-protein kinase 11-interacting protein n=1 Tax=Oncorhynchus tshawytscha TaxID=74940 RepID=A0A8C8GET2_ONCTS